LDSDSRAGDSTKSLVRVFFMKQLPPKEQDKIRKMSDVRLTSCLTRAGITPEELEAMNGSQFIEQWAQVVATAGVSTPPQVLRRKQLQAMTLPWSKNGLLSKN
jgi:hypothetical protein